MKSVGPSAVFLLALALALVSATPVAAECDLDCGAPGGACDVPGCGTA